MFDGFTCPTKNFFQMPNCWIDICAEINSLAELKVIQYVLRHTWGFREYGVKKTITTDEFMYGRKRVDGSRLDKGTGLSNHSVIDGLRAAVAHGYLEVELDATDKARKVKSYALKMVESDVKNLHIQHNHGCEEPSYRPEEFAHRPEEFAHRTEKDTKERHLKKDRESKDATRVSPPTPMSSSSHQTEKPQQGSLIPDTKKKSGKQAEVSPQAQDIIERWMAANGGKPIPMTKALVEAAESLVDCNPSKETLICVKNFAWLNDSNGWYKKHGGVKLGDIVREYEGWQNSQQQAPPSPPPPPPAYRTNLSASNREMAARYAAKKG